jgi:site-specific recombinase XerD
MNCEELITAFQRDCMINSGKESSSRNQHIKTTLHYLMTLDETLNWETMDTQQAKELYGKFLVSSLADTTKALRSRFILLFYEFLMDDNHNQVMEKESIKKLKPHTKKPFVLDESQILTEKQVKSLLSYRFKNKSLPISQKLIMCFTFGAAARINEALHIRFKDVKRGMYSSGDPYYRIFINDTKTNKHRITFVCLPYMVSLLDGYLGTIKDVNQDFYLVSNSDEPLPYSTVRYWYDKLKKCTNIPCLTSHKGRKFNISHRIATGESISSVSMTSHGSPNSPALKHYLHLREEEVLDNVMKSKINL